MKSDLFLIFLHFSLRQCQTKHSDLHGVDSSIKEVRTEGRGVWPKPDKIRQGEGSMFTIFRGRPLRMTSVMFFRDTGDGNRQTAETYLLIDIDLSVS